LCQFGCDYNDKPKYLKKIQLFEHFYNNHSDEELELWGINRKLLGPPYPPPRHYPQDMASDSDTEYNDKPRYYEVPKVRPRKKINATLGLNNCMNKMYRAKKFSEKD